MLGKRLQTGCLHGCCHANVGKCDSLSESPKHQSLCTNTAFVQRGWRVLQPRAPVDGCLQYLHKTEDPFVIIMTVACCGDQDCEKTLRQEAADLMRQMTGGLPGQATASFAVAPMARNSKCYCGSTHKFKKCCGKEQAAA